MKRLLIFDCVQCTHKNTIFICCNHKYRLGLSNWTWNRFFGSLSMTCLVSSCIVHRSTFRKSLNLYCLLPNLVTHTFFMCEKNRVYSVAIHKCETPSIRWLLDIWYSSEHKQSNQSKGPSSVSACNYGMIVCGRIMAGFFSRCSHWQTKGDDAS